MNALESRESLTSIRLTGDLHSSQAIEHAGARIMAGEDPAPERTAARRCGPTVAAVAERYVDEHLKVRCKPATVRTVGAAIRRHIVPRLGRRPLAAVTIEDAFALQHRLA